ncbi:ester cyclase [Nocardia higoensis]|uniref:ester cyclase n=1 Tax=Nocardia higoensis TaxID=228599 RepID=UPI0012F65E34|nr:nuclear transport factor 2 family protein [Nocardia higoensis]
MSTETADLEPTLVSGMTSAELACALPALATAFTEDAQAQALVWRDWLSRWITAWDHYDIEAVLALMTDDVVLEDPGLCGQPAVGRSELREAVTTLLRAFPDVRWEIAGTPHLAIAGTGVAIPWRMRGTFAGDMGGGCSPLGIAPTGRRFDNHGIDLYELRDGLLCRWTSTFDLLDLGRQFGMLPDPRGRLFRFGIRIQRSIAPLLRTWYRFRDHRAR